MAWAYGALVILLAGVGLGFLARYVLLVTLDVPSGLGALVVLAGTVLAAAVALTLARAAALVVNRRAGVPADTRSTAGLGTVVSAIAETVALTTAALLLWPLAAPVWFVVAASLVAWSALAGALAWIMATDLDVLQKPDPARST